MLVVDFQCTAAVANRDGIPDEAQMLAAMQAAWQASIDDDATRVAPWLGYPELEISIRVVGPAESQALNSQYRQRDKPTNVLSFESPPPLPTELLEQIDVAERPTAVLGDIVICADVVAAEARAASIPLSARWMHMLVHGLTHLLGHDHIDDDDAERMTAVEVAALQRLGYENPYVSH
ncbi:MAG: rRNA maturation RNase YbeY [Pseudomonadota bacterium]